VYPTLLLHALSHDAFMAFCKGTNGSASGSVWLESVTAHTTKFKPLVPEARYRGPNVHCVCLGMLPFSDRRPTVLLPSSLMTCSAGATAAQPDSAVLPWVLPASVHTLLIPALTVC
jgi:hypothetical protein